MALYVTCLVDLFRPQAAFAAASLLQRAGCRLVVPRGQTCCGQPALNSGARAQAQRLARRVIAQLEPYERVVLPSGSCAATIVHDYPELLGDDPGWGGRAKALAGKTRELTQYLAEGGLAKETLNNAAAARFKGCVACHDSCSALRTLGIGPEPRALIARLRGATLVELERPEECCGFGGLFCVKYPELSGAMVRDKVADIVRSGADMVVACDLGCLINIAGRIRRENAAIEVRHIAELLSGVCDTPAIGAPSPPRRGRIR